MLACGPATANLSASTTRLRNCTPLFPLPSLIRTWSDSSKSLYFRRLHRNVRNASPSAGTLPTIAPSRTVQYAPSPSQPSRSLPLKNASDSSLPRSGARSTGSAVVRAHTTSRSAPALSPVAALIGFPPLGMQSTRGRSFDDRLHHGRLEVPVNPLHDGSGLGLDQEDAHQLLLGIHPEVGAERPVPAEAAVGAEQPRLDGVHDHLDAQAESHPLAAPELAAEHIADLVRRVELDRAGAEQAMPVQLSTIDQHLGEPEVVGRAGDQPAGAREIALGEAERERTLFQTLCGAAVDRGQAGLAVVRYDEEGVL